MNLKPGRILAVDPGERRIGLAISDPSGTIANPLKVIKHISRIVDAAAIANTAKAMDAELIIVGQALDSEGRPGPMARRAARIAEAIRLQSEIPVLLWDESGSTEIARSARVTMGLGRKKRTGHLDDLAALVILQSYLDAQKENLASNTGGRKVTD
jgi:putative holliday junction resolvase